MLLHLATGSECHVARSISADVLGCRTVIQQDFDRRLLLTMQESQRICLINIIITSILTAFSCVQYGEIPVWYHLVELMGGFMVCLVRCQQALLADTSRWWHND